MTSDAMLDLTAIACLVTAGAFTLARRRMLSKEHPRWADGPRMIQGVLAMQAVFYFFAAILTGSHWHHADLVEVLGWFFGAVVSVVMVINLERTRDKLLDGLGRLVSGKAAGNGQVAAASSRPEQKTRTFTSDRETRPPAH